MVLGYWTQTSKHGVRLLHGVTFGFVYITSFSIYFTQRLNQNIDGTEYDGKEDIRKLHCGAKLCLVTQLCLSVCGPWTIACQAPLSMGFPRQEYWSGLPFPPSEDLPDPGIKPRYPVLQGNYSPLEPPGKPRAKIASSTSIAGTSEQLTTCKGKRI